MNRRSFLKRTATGATTAGGVGLAGCTPGGTGTPLDPTPVAGKLVLANNSERGICEVYVAPFGRQSREQDLLVLANTPNRIDTGDQFVIAAADYAALDEGTPYSLRVVSCSGGLSNQLTDSFSFERGAAATVNEWVTPTP